MRLTISACKMNIELHESLNSLMISKRSSIEKILNILLLRQKEPLRRRGNLNPKEVTQRTKIRHKNLITKMSLNKGNVLKVITGEESCHPCKEGEESYHEVTCGRRETNHQRWRKNQQL
jgi:hypothetical protein